MAWVKPQAEVEAHLRQSPEVVAGVKRVADHLQDLARSLAELRATGGDGTYRRLILVFDTPGGAAVVATAKHSWFVEVGTGVHGPLRRPILASEVTYGGFFRWEENGETIYASMIQGRPARHIMRDAAIATAELPGVTWNPLLDT